MININGKDVNGIIKWDNNDVDTSTPGSFYYQGTIEQYGRVVNLELNINPIVIEKKIGQIKEINDSYIAFDEIEFYTGPEALNEAKKDNSNWIFRDDDGREYIPNGYYIRNNSSEITTYTIDENTVFEICVHLLRDVYNNAAEVEPVSYDVFKEKESGRFAQLFWIYTEDNRITKIQEQFTP
jgi:hypothetical protein